MTELTPEQRIAALKAKRALNAEPAGPADEPSGGSSPAPGPARGRSAAPIPATPVLSRARVLTACTSTVGFAAMVVAMGPLRAPAPAEVDATGADPATDPAETDPGIPPAPSVGVDVSPSQLALVDKNETTPATLAADGSPVSADAATATQAAPTAQAPATQAPVTAAPATQAPTAAAPTAAPTTAAPTTATPTTAAPTTAAPSTAPPTTKGSG